VYHKTQHNIVSLTLRETVEKSMGLSFLINALMMESVREIKVNAQVQEYAHQVILNVQITVVSKELENSHNATSSRTAQEISQMAH
jgi:hypothetical protein